MSVLDERVTCRFEGCTFRSHYLLGHVLQEHNLTPEQYLAQFPGAPTMSNDLLQKFQNRSVPARRTPIPKPVDLKVTLMGMEMPVQASVPVQVCKELPDNYTFPTEGKAKEVFKRALIALSKGRNVFLWGPPGTGKDALVHAFSFYTRRPVAELTFKPGTDISPWFYTRAIDGSGTSWEYGYLWKILTEGVKDREGVAKAAIVLLSDVDRADMAQAEWFRVLCDSMGGRILDPQGEMKDLFPGTQFICTANTCGSGDSRGRMASANPIDASILDRLGRKIEAAYMEWDDEGGILRAKFPSLAEKAPEIFKQLGDATASVRRAIAAEQIFAELTHRGLVEILSECDDIVSVKGRAPDNILKMGFNAWLDGLDGDTRLAAKRLIDPHLKGGALTDLGGALTYLDF